MLLPGGRLQDRRDRVGGGHPRGVQQVGRPVGGPAAQVPGKEYFLSKTNLLHYIILIINEIIMIVSRRRPS